MRIFVGGIPYTTNSEGLRSLFAQAGSVTDATVVQDKYTGDSKGFGFVEMPDAGEARTAITRFNGHSLDGRELTVNEAKPREDRNGNGNRAGYGGGGGGGRSGGGRW
jgi:RNA recognition motif-containing protein